MLDATLLARDNANVELQAITGAKIKATLGQEITPGKKVKFLVRPENLRILGPGEQADNELTAKLRDRILLGHVTKYYATLLDGSEISASQMTSPGQPVLHPGEEVRFGFDRQGTVCLPLPS